MENNEVNIKRALNETWGQWGYYWEQCKKQGEDVVLSPRNFKYCEGDIIYIQLQVGYPHEMTFGHWCYVVKDLYNKVLIIPTTHCEGDVVEKYEMDIPVVMDGIPTFSRLQFSDIRTVDKQRIDSRKGVVEVCHKKESIIERLKEFIGG